MDSEIFLLRMTLMQLTERVQYLEEERDVVEMRTLLVQDQLQEVSDVALFHHQVLEEVINQTDILELHVERMESQVSLFGVWLEFAYRQLVQLMALYSVL